MTTAEPRQVTSSCPFPTVLSRRDAHSVAMAGVDSVWRDVVDVDVHPGFVDCVMSARVLHQQAADRRTAAYSVAIGHDVVAWVLDERIDEPRMMLSFVQLAGPFHRFEGAWSVTRLPTASLVGLRVGYEIHDEWLSSVLGADGANLQRVMDSWVNAIGTWAGTPG
ncbi:MAG: SRPBCC family protein [Ilumatobacteraceae bacterium]